jgi:hypothetical protein
LSGSVFGAAKFEGTTHWTELDLSARGAHDELGYVCIALGIICVGFSCWCFYPNLSGYQKKEKIMTETHQHTDGSVGYGSVHKCIYGYKSQDDGLILDHSVGIEEFIGQAVGAASMCWENPEGAGVFDADRAKQIVEEIMDHLAVLLR